MTFVLLDTPTGDLALSRVRSVDVARSRLGGTSLDRRLAAGESPESERLLAVRATAITTGPFRRRLARDLLGALRRAGENHCGSRIPLARSAIAAALPEIEELAAVLRASTLVSASTVASARLLLVDPTSPVYAGSRRTNVSGEIRRILDPTQRSAPAMGEAR